MPITIEELERLEPVRQRLSDLLRIQRKSSCKTYPRYIGALSIDGFNFAINLFCSLKGEVSSVALYNASSKEQNKEQYIKHLDKRKEYHTERYVLHQKEINECTMKWRKENPECNLEIRRKSNVKRQKALGYKPLNKPFEGAEGHHVNKEVIIYIPATLHRSIRHNVFTGKNMEEINDKAFRFLGEENNIRSINKAQKEEF